eukprot:1202376-Rhodomonas_salina.1
MVLQSATMLCASATPRIAWSAHGCGPPMMALPKSITSDLEPLTPRIEPLNPKLIYALDFRHGKVTYELDFPDGAEALGGEVDGDEERLDQLHELRGLDARRQRCEAGHVHLHAAKTRQHKPETSPSASWYNTRQDHPETSICVPATHAMITLWTGVGEGQEGQGVSAAQR